MVLPLDGVEDDGQLLVADALVVLNMEGYTEVVNVAAAFILLEGLPGLLLPVDFHVIKL